uniref:Uncharacterized protein n=1 Tax=Stomoxys calcitrans TaxID=35570 RepID=A0A1I8P7D8_STOCA
MADVAERSLRASRKAHISFICKVYLLAATMVTCSICQWIIITMNQEDLPKLLKRYNFITLAIMFSNFLIMLPMQYLLHSGRPKSKFLTVVYIIFTMELSSTILVRPIAQSTTSRIAMAAGLTSCVMLVSLLVALRFHLELEQDALYLTLWTMRYFLLTSICLLMTLSFDDQHVQISIALLLTFFVSIFIIIWARSLGSLIFYEDEAAYLGFYITLAFLIFLTLFVNAVVLFEYL